VSNRTKFVFGAIFIFSWIGFWRWADSTLPEEARIEVAQSKTPQEVCSDLIFEKNSLEDAASNMGNKANELQRTLLRQRLDEIISKEVLSSNEDMILADYLSYDLKKIVAQRSEAFGEAMLRNIELKPQAVKIVNKLIKAGELEPYLFSEVQQMGQDLRAKFQEARDLTEANPDCFKSTLEIDKLIDEATKELDKSNTYNGWIAKKTAEDLIDSIL
jgi:hypothetical protein